LVHNNLPFISFADVTKILPKLSNEAELGIFSQGFLGLQLAKLWFHGYKNYFSKNQIYIDLNKLALLKEIATKNKDRRITIIDNQPGIIQGVEKSGFGINTILIDRKSKYPSYQGKKLNDFFPLTNWPGD